MLFCAQATCGVLQIISESDQYTNSTTSVKSLLHQQHSFPHYVFRCIQHSGNTAILVSSNVLKTLLLITGVSTAQGSRHVRHQPSTSETRQQKQLSGRSKRSDQRFAQEQGHNSARVSSYQSECRDPNPTSTTEASLQQQQQPGRLQGDTFNQGYAEEQRHSAANASSYQPDHQQHAKTTTEETRQHQQQRGRFQGNGCHSGHAQEQGRSIAQVSSTQSEHSQHSQPSTMETGQQQEQQQLGRFQRNQSNPRRYARRQGQRGAQFSSHPTEHRLHKYQNDENRGDQGSTRPANANMNDTGYCQSHGSHEPAHPDSQHGGKQGADRPATATASDTGYGQSQHGSKQAYGNTQQRGQQGVDRPAQTHTHDTGLSRQSQNGHRKPYRLQEQQQGGRHASSSRGPNAANTSQKHEPTRLSHASSGTGRDRGDGARLDARAGPRVPGRVVEMPHSQAVSRQ